MANHFKDNLKYIREQRGLSKNRLGELAGVNQSTIGRWESGEMAPTIDNVIDLMNALHIPIYELGNFLENELKFDNVTAISSDIIKIPIYASIKAGIPLESQTDIIEYMNIPKEWTKGAKKLFGIQLSGDSMFPKYNDKEVVIFEQNFDLEYCKNKDVAVMINNTESTFKKLLVNEHGIVLVPYNIAYDVMMFSNDDINNKPITIIGVAVKKVSDIKYES